MQVKVKLTKIVADSGNFIPYENKIDTVLSFCIAGKYNKAIQLISTVPSQVVICEVSIH